MNPTKLTTSLMRIANELRGEADRWSGGRRRNLILAADQLAHTGLRNNRGAIEPAVAESLLDAGTNVLIDHMTARLNRDHLNAPPKGTRP